MGTVKDIGTFSKENKYSIYVLVILMLAYLINQCQTFCLIATNNGMAQDIKYGEKECQVYNETLVKRRIEASGKNLTSAEYCKTNETECTDFDEVACYYRYYGRGIQYQLLAGPLYIVLFSISGIPMGLISELSNINRKLILALCVMLWSAMTALGGFATQYWHLAVTRLLLGVFSAGCVPFSASLLSDYFPQALRGAALGFFNWGIYLGYSITFLLIIAERNVGWRAVYFFVGTPGILLGIILLITIKEPPRGGLEGQKEKALSKLSNTCGKLQTAAKCFLDPVLLLLCLGGAIRNGAGIVWAYNIRNFFDEYHPGTVIEAWMSWIPLIFGSIGAFGGGVLSDKLSANRGTSGRLMVLIVCVTLSAPFQVGTLYLPMPWAFICHIPAYMIGEMWIGVCAAVVIDLVPSDLTTSAVALYFFIIQIIGGNMNLFVTPIREALDLRTALLITFPGVYLVGAFFFVLTLIALKCCKKEQKHDTLEEDEKTIGKDDVNVYVESPPEAKVNPGYQENYTPGSQDDPNPSYQNNPNSGVQDNPNPGPQNNANPGLQDNYHTKM